VATIGPEVGRRCTVHGELYMGNEAAGWMMNPWAPHGGRLEAKPRSVRFEGVHEAATSTF
jgi:hypothetical protein